MNAQERIANIGLFAEKKRMEEIDKKNAVAAHIEELLGKVRSFAPRMKDLLKVGQALYENGIPLGPYDESVPGYRDDNSRIFVSNGWSHRTGFIIAYRINGHIPSRTQQYPIGFGIIGGGCAGEDLTFNADGELEWLNRPFGHPAGCSDRPWGPKDTQHLERFVAEFDEFERRFYEYVDGLA